MKYNNEIDILNLIYILDEHTGKIIIITIILLFIFIYYCIDGITKRNKSIKNQERIISLLEKQNKK